MRLEEAMRRLKAREADLRAMGIDHLYLFGSTARGEEREDSDVDLFFDDDGSIGLFEYMHIKERTSEILGVKADIMSRDSINKHYRPYIEPDAIPVF